MNLEEAKIAKEQLPKIISALRTSRDNADFRKTFTENFFSEKGFEDFEKMLHVYALVNIFVQENQISCAEATVDDKIYEKAPEFVESLADVVGYYKDEEDDE